MPEIDNFDDGDLSEYDSVPSTWYTQTNTVYEGTHAVRNDADNGDHQLISTSGLSNYPSAGDTFEYYARREGVADSALTVNFAYVSNDNRYLLADDPVTDELSFRKEVDNSFTTIASAGSSVPLDTWARFEVDWGAGGSFSFLSENPDTGTTYASFSATDTDFSSGGFAWAHSNFFNDQVGFFDSASILGGTAPTAPSNLSATLN